MNAVINMPKLLQITGKPKEDRFEKNLKIVKKTRVKLPDEIVDVISCPNPRCVTNKEREPITSKYAVVSKSPIVLKCLYCWNFIEEVEIIRQFTTR